MHFSYRIWFNDELKEIVILSKEIILIFLYKLWMFVMMETRRTNLVILVEQY